MAAHPGALRAALSAALWMGGSVLSTGLAAAETYRLLEGTLEDERSGASEALGGTLEISVFEPEGQDVRPSLLVDAFQIATGSQIFGPRQPIEFEGRGVLWIQIADQIQFDGDVVGLVQLRSGGELIAVEDNDLTFRFTDFRSDPSGESRLIGQLADGLLPRRIVLSGILYEVDQHFLVPSGECPIGPFPPGGGVVIGSDGGASLTRVTGGSTATIDGTLTATGSLALLNPAGAVLGATRIALSEALPSAGDLHVAATTAVDIPFCTAIRAVFPAEEREIGRFSFVASAARQVEIEVDARRRGEGRHSGHHGPVAVTILGSPDFDIRDVDEGSLRLGPGEAEPKRRHGRGRSSRLDVNRDGEMDLLVRFDLEDARIGRRDREVCLFGETRDAEAIEGCDAIARRSADKKHKKDRRADGDDD